MIFTGGESIERVLSICRNTSVGHGLMNLCSFYPTDHKRGRENLHLYYNDSFILNQYETNYLTEISCLLCLLLYMCQLISFLSTVLFFKEKCTLSWPEPKPISFDSAPTFTVPLKTHSSPEKYECYMSCAVRGNPSPHVTWYRNNISLNTNTNYYISNTCGVCSLQILKVGPKDNGEYKAVAENSLGRTECTTQLIIRGK